MKYPDAVLTGSAAARLTFWAKAPIGPLTFANVRSEVATTRVRLSTVRVRPEDILTRGVFRLTTPARTALDLAVRTGARSIDEVLRTGQATLSELWDVWASSPHRPGNQGIRDLLLDSRDEPWSGSERLCHRLLRSSGIKGWATNHPVTVDDQLYYLDVAFEDVRLYVEIDGVHHRDDEAIFQSDRVRQNALTAAGWTPLRYTGTRLECEPTQVTREIRALLVKLRRGATR